jgi:hypothetical protein
MVQLKQTLQDLATPQKAPVDKVALAVNNDEIDIHYEIRQQHKVVVKLREQLIDPITGDIQEKIPTRTAKETISAFTSFLTAVMRVEDKVDRTRQLKLVEDLTVATVKKYLTDEQQDEFLLKLEQAYER